MINDLALFYELSRLRLSVPISRSSSAKASCAALQIFSISTTNCLEVIPLMLVVDINISFIIGEICNIASLISSI